MTDQPWKPATGDEVGTLGDDTMFVGFFEPPTKHQPENPVDELLLDICEEFSRWNSVISFHVEVRKAVVDLWETLSIVNEGDRSVADLWKVCNMVCGE